MISSPEFDEKTFERVALSALAYLHSQLSLIVKDLRSDRGPYAITAGVFYLLCKRTHRRSLLIARVKLQFGPDSNGDARDLCDEVEIVLESFQQAFVYLLEKHAFSKRSLIKSFLSSSESTRSLATVCGQDLVVFDDLLKQTEECLVKWSSKSTTNRVPQTDQ
jgi:hypothetical protein